MGVNVFLIFVSGKRNDSLASTQPLGVWQGSLVVGFEISNAKGTEHLDVSRSESDSKDVVFTEGSCLKSKSGCCR